MQRLIIHKIINSITSTEDPNNLVNLLNFLIQWVSPQNKAIKFSEEDYKEKDKQDKESWNHFRARFLIELSSID
jgi:hypothetical protein